MGISKEDYLKKLNEVWQVLRRESSGDFNDLDSERYILAYILGAEIENLLVKVIFNCPSDDGSHFIKKDYSAYLRDAIQRLLTKANVGIQKEKKLNEKYEYEHRKLVNEKQRLERSLSDCKREIHDLEKRIECMVGIDEYDELVDDYNALVDEITELKKELPILRKKKDELVSENKILKGEKEQAEQDRDTAKKLAGSHKKALKEMSDLYEKEKARADKAVNDLQVERNKPVVPIVVTKVDNAAITKLQNEVSELSTKIKEKDTLISDKETEISNKDKVIAGKNKQIQNNQEHIDKLVSKANKLQHDLDSYKSTISTLQGKIEEFEKDEKKIVPTLQQVVYRRSYQGKSITLSDKEIDRVIRCHLKGMSAYQIHNEYGIAESSVKKIVNCSYKTLSASKKILSALHRVNGNWGEERKEVLQQLIERYEQAVSEKEAEAQTVKKDIENRVQSISEYNNEVQGHKKIKSV